MSAPRRTVVITGASAGIGRAFAEVFAEKGFDTVLVARRRERLELLAADIERRFGGKSLAVALDLSEPDAPARLVERLEADGIAVDGLVNNAGYGIDGSFSDIPWPELDAFLRVLLVSQAELCRRFLPGMRERGWGRVINVASLAAFVPPRPGDSYSATKAFLIRLSKSLALEHRGTGVHVTAVCPGFTYTEFHEAMGVADEATRIPRWLWMDAETVARQGYDAVMKGRPVLINGWRNRLIALISALIPDSLVYALSPKGALKKRKGRASTSADSDSR